MVIVSLYLDPNPPKPTPLEKLKKKMVYTVLHKLVFNIKKLFGRFNLRTKLGTYGLRTLFLLKDTFKEDVDPEMWEKEFMKYLKENNIELDNTISEEVELVNGMLPKGLYKLTQDITFDKEDADTPDALMGDEVQTFEDTAPSDTVLGVDIFSVVHIPTQTKIFVSAEDVQKNRNRGFRTMTFKFSEIMKKFYEDEKLGIQSEDAPDQFCCILVEFP